MIDVPSTELTISQLVHPNVFLNQLLIDPNEWLTRLPSTHLYMFPMVRQSGELSKRLFLCRKIFLFNGSLCGYDPIYVLMMYFQLFYFSPKPKSFCVFDDSLSRFRPFLWHQNYFFFAKGKNSLSRITRKNWLLFLTKTDEAGSALWFISPLG